MPKSITISRTEEYHRLVLNDVPWPVPKPNELLLKVVAAALNHRDLYIRQNLYPSISFKNPLLADGCAIVLPHPDAAGSIKFPASQRVIINPGTGWLSDSSGPEAAYTVLGGSSTTALGTLQEIIAVPVDDVVPAPEHLSDVEAAALPLTGLTAWRAFETKSTNAEPGRNILVTGIGGGVALMVLLFAVAKGCNVFVTSSSVDKIDRAKSLGANGGVDYTDEEGWPKKLKSLLPKDRPFLDAVIDGAGGNIIGNTWKLLKLGGVVVSYGITSIDPPRLPMQAVMKNIELKGSTMGSRREFTDMVRFVDEKKIRPVVERVVHGIENLVAIDGLFDIMKKCKQFGKLVVRIGSDSEGHKGKAKL
ncbi:MAG: hypothetical protein Q9191_006748, partial [Dirinaria sp. TL-2023a]